MRFLNLGPFRDTATVHISVEDVDEPPVFEPSFYFVEVPEDVDIGTTIQMIYAKDPDVTNNSIRFFSSISLISTMLTSVETCLLLWWNEEVNTGSNCQIQWNASVTANWTTYCWASLCSQNLHLPEPCIRGHSGLTLTFRVSSCADNVRPLLARCFQCTLQFQYRDNRLVCEVKIHTILPQENLYMVNTAVSPWMQMHF